MLPPRALLLVCLPLWLAACGSAVEACGRSVQAPDLDVAAVVGRDLETGDATPLAGYAGRTLLVNVWGSWCEPCRVEQPELQDTWATLSAARDDIAFLGVAVRDNEAAARAFREEFGVTYPSLFDDTNQIAHDLGVTVPPATAIVDRDGIVRYLHIGQISGTTAGCLVTAVADG